MEFDNRIHLKETGSLRLEAGMAPASLHQRLWDIFSASAAHVGDAGAGEFWLDFSDLLRTRHLVVDFPMPEEDAAGAEAQEAAGADSPAASMPQDCVIRFRGGSKLSPVGDVVVMALALLAFWCLSHLLVPRPPVAAVAGFVLCAAAAVGLVLWAGRNFGRKETDELIEKIRP